jgi:hypothetical protein
MVNAAMTNFDDQEKSEYIDISSHIESFQDNQCLLDQSKDEGMRPDTFKGTIYGDSMIEQSPPANNPLNNPKSLGSDN